ncbi:hypothetical protein FRC00_013562, partial [Tulasnella sp. 408]
DTAIYYDFDQGDLESMYRFIDRYTNLMEYSAFWLLAVSGALLFCMAILNVMQRRPRNR